MRHIPAAAPAWMALLAASLLSAQDAKPPHAMPSDEHAFLHQFAGEWKTNGRGTDLSGKDVDMVGFESDRMVIGDFWLSFVYRSQVNDKLFVGHGMIGYDPQKKKYVGIWVDSMSPYLTSLEGTADRQANTLTMDSTGVDPATEKACRGRLVFHVQDSDHRTLQSFRVDDGQKGQMVFDQHYTRVEPQSK